MGPKSSRHSGDLIQICLQRSHLCSVVSPSMIVEVSIDIVLLFGNSRFLTMTMYICIYICKSLQINPSSKSSFRFLRFRSSVFSEPHSLRWLCIRLCSQHLEYLVSQPRRYEGNLFGEISWPHQHLKAPGLRFKKEPMNATIHKNFIYIYIYIIIIFH